MLWKKAMKFLNIVLVPIVLIMVGCNRENTEAERWEELQFKVTLRSEPYKKGDTINSGEFEDLVLVSLPVEIEPGPGAAHAVKDGVWVHVAWDNLTVNTRLNQLAFQGFRRKIDNRLVAPYGTSWRLDNWQELGDVAISAEWDTRAQ